MNDQNSTSPFEVNPAERLAPPVQTKGDVPPAPKKPHGNKGRNKGKPLSEETRRKISEALKGRKLTEGHKKKIRQAAKEHEKTIDHFSKKQKAVSKKKPKNIILKDSDIKRAFEGFTFDLTGNISASRMQMLADGVLNLASGLQVGVDIERICFKAGLLTPSFNPSKRGIRWATDQLRKSMRKEP